MFRVTAPLVVVRSHDETVYLTVGHMVDGVSEADAARLVKLGMIEPADGVADAPAPVVPEARQTAVAEGQDLGKPKKTHGLDKWQAYAVSQGLTDEDIAGASKAELIALIG
ncbi:hypothetical protein [Gordonia caeni]|uniref:Uncharacterized protein n=1 Tax=Gordonia caeni TaxID=1007097 RepID=A0ABP7PE61_9ACTN